MHSCSCGKIVSLLVSLNFNSAKVSKPALHPVASYKLFRFDLQPYKCDVITLPLSNQATFSPFLYNKSTAFYQRCMTYLQLKCSYVKLQTCIAHVS